MSRSLWRTNRRMLAGLLALLLLAAFGANAEAPAGPESIRLPRVEACAQTPSGTKTTWSCVWFGSYPSAEVVDAGWDAVDDYALQEGDLIRDDALYARLSEADWQGDTLELDGARYLRLGLDSAPAGGAAREQHYRWAYSRPWHYFAVSPIRWRVLDLRDRKALLLADRMPDCAPFHAVDEDVAWQDSTLRSWLNGYGPEANRQGADYRGTSLIDRAFTEEERAAILPTPCENLANLDYGTDSGADTEDRLFLLSNAQVFEGADAGRYGFDPSRDYDDPAKRFTSTLYAKCRGAWWSPVEAYAGNSFWFMRTSGYTPRSVTYVCDFGYIYSKGTLVTCGDAGVLPALWVDLARAGLEDAGEAASTDILRATEAGAGDYPIPALENPVRVASDDMPGGSYTVWNTVTFGHYPQTAVDGEAEPALLDRLEAAGGDRATLDGVDYRRLDGRWFRCDPITWRVLEVTDSTALLMADRCLDTVPFDAEYKDVFWEDSDLRQWLNGTGEAGESFLEAAFTPQERQAIALSAVPNAANHYFGTACGSGTRDRVFILSEEEVFSSDRAERYGFQPSDAIADMGRRLAPTDYAAARGAWISGGSGTEGIGFWLLRTNGYTRDNVVYVGEKGYLYNRGIPVTCADAGIVPALRVRLGSAPLERAEDRSTRPDGD